MIETIHPAYTIRNNLPETKMQKTITTLLALTFTLTGCGNRLTTNNLDIPKPSLVAKTQNTQSNFEKI